MKFFFDNHLAPRIAHGLHQLVEPEHHVVHLKDRFASNIEDPEWMRALAGESDLVIVTADVRIRRNPHELRAWKEAGHTVFFLKPGWVNLPFWEQVNKFTKCFPALIETARHARRGSAFLVSVNGKIEALK